MSPIKTRTITVATVSGLLALGIGLGVAQAAPTETTPPGNSSVTPGAAANQGNARGMGMMAGRQGGMGGAGMGAAGMNRGGMDFSALADDLGVTEGDLTAALQKVRADLRPTTTPTAPPTTADRAEHQQAFASALAKELGIDEAKVTDALEGMQAERRAEAKATLTTKLDAAVQAGTLTAADKASVLNAFDAGVLGRMGH